MPRIVWIALACAAPNAACRSEPRPMDHRTPAAHAAASSSTESASEPGESSRAEELDRTGQLADALPLYARRAERTNRDADRLRYARALLRAGREAEATQIFDAIANDSRLSSPSEPDSFGDARAGKAVVAASAALAGGFPSIAVAYARTAAAAGDGPRPKLLLLRALLAAGDTGAARSLSKDLVAASRKWETGARYELARSLVALGDVTAATGLLSGPSAGAVAPLFRGSVLANVSFQRGDFAKAAELLAGSETSAPADLSGRVSREWRNARRELLSVRLRRAVALLRLGNAAEAAAEAGRAQVADEESVRSGALLLVASNLFDRGRRGDALGTLDALAGHDPRFEPAVATLKAALAASAVRHEDVTPFEKVLVAEDASSGFVAERIADVLASSASACLATARTYASSP